MQILKAALRTFIGVLWIVVFGPFYFWFFAVLFAVCEGFHIRPLWLRATLIFAPAGAAHAFHFLAARRKSEKQKRL